MKKTLKPRKVDFSELTRMLEKYERKFGYSTIEFFRRYSEGTTSSCWPTEIRAVVFR